MQKITEEEAWSLAGGAECPVIRKEESDEMEAAVCLKHFPNGYLLGVSDKLNDLQLWFSADIAAMEQKFDEFFEKMEQHGSPFGG